MAVALPPAGIQLGMFGDAHVCASSRPMAHEVPQESVGDRVRRFRRIAKMTQEELAAAADVDRRHLAKIEVGGIAEPSADVIRRIAKALNVPLRSIAEPLGWYDDEEDMDSTRWVVAMRGDPTLDERTKEIIEQVLELGRAQVDRTS